MRKYRQWDASHQPEEMVRTGECPKCGERRMDSLVWDEDGVLVTCQSCGCEYDPTTAPVTKEAVAAKLATFSDEELAAMGLSRKKTRGK